MNAGREGSEILAHLANADPAIGYNAQTDTLGRLFEEGVIDPTKVVRNALQTASSIAALVLTTEALVADFEEEDKDKVDGNPAIII